MKRIKKTIWTMLGTLFVVVGIVGVFVPLLPTTPFLLLAAACYMRGSKRAYDWLMNNRWLGAYVSNYVEKKGIPKNTKMISITLLWLTMGYSAVFIASTAILKIVLLAIALAVTTHILTISTLE